MFLDVLLLFLPLAIAAEQPLAAAPAAIWVVFVLVEANWLRVLSRRRGRESVYFFSDKGQVVPLVKIGRAKNYAQRLAAHRTAAPFGLSVYLVLFTNNSVQVENILHHRYHSLRVRDNYEWFYCPLWLRMAFLLASIGHRNVVKEQSR